MNAFCEKECAFSGRGLITLASCAICRADKSFFRDAISLTVLAYTLLFPTDERGAR